LNHEVPVNNDCIGSKSEALDLQTDFQKMEFYNPWKTLGIKSRFFYRPVCAVITSSLQPTLSFIDNLKSVISPRLSRLGRVSAVINLFDSLLPGSVKRFANFLCDSDGLPVVKGHTTLLASGTSVIVFLVETLDNRNVVKIYKKSLGRNPQGMQKIANFHKKKYELATCWFKDTPKLIVPSLFIILPATLFKSPALACIQPYVEGIKKDFFNDYTDSELLSLMANHPELSEQFIYFATKTIQLYSDDNIFIDLLGNENLILIENDHGITLKLIDYGMAPMDIWKIRSAEICSRIEVRMARLRSLLDEVAALCPGSPASPASFKLQVPAPCLND
jgi:hypothetical protein